MEKSQTINGLMKVSMVLIKDAELFQAYSKYEVSNLIKKDLKVSMFIWRAFEN